MGVTVRLGDWGILDVLGPEDRVPAPLLAVRSLWEGDPRKLPATLTLRRGGTVHPYLACWPGSAPAPDPRDPDLDGVALGEPALLRCFACGAEHDGIYPDTGLPGFGVEGHALVRGCPTCGADQSTSRITALAIGEARPGRAVPTAPRESGTRPVLLVVSFVAYLAFLLLLITDATGSVSTSAVWGLVAGVAVHVPPALTMHRAGAFRWLVGAYGVVTVLGFFAGGFLVLPSVLVMAFAAMAPPAPRDWRMSPGLTTSCVAAVLGFLVGAMFVAIR